MAPASPISEVRAVSHLRASLDGTANHGGKHEKAECDRGRGSIASGRNSRMRINTIGHTCADSDGHADATRSDRDCDGHA